MSTPVRITDRLSVSTQPSLGEIGSLPEAGFTTLINNRPDGEDAAQPGTAAEAKAAEAAGLAYRHIPVTGPTITADAIHAFGTAIETAPGPVLAHCKGGTRSLTLYVLHEVLSGRMTPEEVVPFGERHGFDLRGALVWLARHAG